MQRMVSYPLSGNIGEPSERLKEQGTELDSTIQLVQKLTGLRKEDNSIEEKRVGSDLVTMKIKPESPLH